MINIDYRKSLAFTGHRPNKLASYNYRHPENLKMLVKLKAIICRYIERRGITTFITGMALGIDIWSAQIILQLKDKYPHIKLVCAIPCLEQYKKWNDDDIDTYHHILERADLVYYVSDKPYTDWCMIDRDKWMVDNVNFLLAVWNGDESGGTWRTVEYAIKRQRNILCLNLKTLETNFL